MKLPSDLEEIKENVKNRKTFPLIINDLFVVKIVPMALSEFNILSKHLINETDFDANRFVFYTYTQEMYRVVNNKLVEMAVEYDLLTAGEAQIVLKAILSNIEEDDNIEERHLNIDKKRNIEIDL